LDLRKASAAVFEKQHYLDDDVETVISAARQQLIHSKWGPALLEFCRDYNVSFIMNEDQDNLVNASYVPDLNVIQCGKKEIKGKTLGHEIRHAQQFQYLLKDEIPPTTLRHCLIHDTILEMDAYTIDSVLEFSTNRQQRRLLTSKNPRSGQNKLKKMMQTDFIDAIDRLYDCENSYEEDFFEGLTVQGTLHIDIEGYITSNAVRKLEGLSLNFLPSNLKAQVLERPPEDDIQYMARIIRKVGEFPDGTGSYTKGKEEELAKAAWKKVFTPERQKKIQAYEAIISRKVDFFKGVQLAASAAHNAGFSI